MALIVLQAVTTQRGSSSVAGGFDVIAGMVDRVFDPDVPAIPNFAHRTGRDEELETAPAPPKAESKSEGSSVPNFDKIPGLGD